MAKILGIETSCDETAVSVFDFKKKEVLSNVIFSQVDLHKKYGGVVPEIASRSQLKKIYPVYLEALQKAQVTLDEIEAIAVTSNPGLMGSLLVGISFAKGLALAKNKKFIEINHLEGHIFSPFLEQKEKIPFPHLSLTASGGHTAFQLVHDFGNYEIIEQTRDDSAGEAFDKIAKILGLGYPGGAIIEKRASEIKFRDVYRYPRTKIKDGNMLLSFSGLKTAVLYNLVKQGAYNLNNGPIIENINTQLQQEVSSSLLVCITDIFINNIKLAIKKYPQIKAITFGGGVACNNYIKKKLFSLCNNRLQLPFFFPKKEFCMDNGAMIAFVGGYKFKI
jgi:N6-L-threonylcarbamoyladenine synthase